MTSFAYGERLNLNLISETFVKPKNEVNASKQPYYLGPIDLNMLSLNPMQKGLLFNTKPKVMQSYLDQLNDALSIALVQFYPLAGRLTTEKYPEKHACWIYVDCNKGRGARIIHASNLDLKVSDILSSVDVHPIVKLFFDLGLITVNHDGHTNPLVSIQITELQDGIFIGFTMNYSLADGTTLWHFISNLSEIFLQSFHGEEKKSVSREPIIETFFPQGYGPVLELPYLEPEEFVSRFVPWLLRERIFHFSPESMAKLKAKANEQLDDCTIKISSFQALCAFVWTCVTRARKLDHKLDTFCTMVTNLRPRLEPQISENHFGNIVGVAQSKCIAGELLGSDLGWASALINKSIIALDGKRALEFVTSKSKDPSVAVLAGFANKDNGKVTANPGREGEGSVDLEVCLKADIMSALENDEEFMSFVSSNVTVPTTSNG